MLLKIYCVCQMLWFLLSPSFIGPGLPLTIFQTIVRLENTVGVTMNSVMRVPHVPQTWKLSFWMSNLIAFTLELSNPA